MDRERVDKWLEKGILGLVLAILIYGPLALGAVRPLDMVVLQSLVLLCMALWLARCWISPQPRLLVPPISWAILIFVGYAIVRYLEADIEYVARQELIKVLLYAFLFFIILNNLYRQDDAQTIVLVILFLGMAISLYALFQFLTESPLVWKFVKPQQYAGRASGTYFCPNHLAGFLEMLLPLGLAFTLVGRLGHATKIIVGYATLAIFAGIGVTISRAGWIAAGLSMLAFFALLLRHRGKRLPAVIVLVCILGAGAWAYSQTRQFKTRLAQTFEAGTLADYRIRPWLWDSTIRMWKDHFWWGVGPGHFDSRFRLYRRIEVQGRPLYAHNDYLNTLADWGIAGSIVIGSAVLILFWGVARTWRYVERPGNDLSSKSSNKWALLLGASAGLLAILVHSVADFNMHIPANAILAVTLMALVSTLLRFASESFWCSSPWLVRSLVSISVLAGLLYLVPVTWKQGQEVMWSRKSATVSDRNPARKVALLEKAHAVEPMNPDTVYEIGELLRLQSWQGQANNEELARKAMDWFGLGMRLNPHDSYPPLRYAMCLDWLGRSSEAGHYYELAVKLDPHGHYTAAIYGWHFLRINDFEHARKWFETSLRYHWNLTAHNYLEKVKRKLAEPAKGI